MNQTGSRNRYDTRFGSSLGSRGGQVSVRETSEGDQRNGKNESRGCVSPLGGAGTQRSGDQSGKVERDQQATRGYGSKPYGGDKVG